MLDLIIKGGQVVTPQGVGDLEVAIQDGKVAAVAHPGVLEAETKEIIDATGKIVLPGGIEPHMVGFEGECLEDQEVEGASH